jgi:hypothetical protein
MEEDDVAAEETETAGKNTPTAETLWEILRPAMKDLAEGNREAYDILRALAEDGSLEQHRTSGQLDDIARRLLDTLGEGESGHAD